MEKVVKSILTTLMLAFSAQSIVATPSDELVGKTEDEFMVTPMGQANYEIPIPALPGTGGITPKLTVNYNSSTKTGLLGYGFDLKGLSIISRVPRNKFNDGSAGYVNFTALDNYALDGMRLIKGSVAQSLHQFYTENDCFSKILSYGAYENPDSFVVRTKDGLKYLYLPNTKILDSTSTENALFWMLVSVQDTNGNYFTVSYTGNNDYNEIYPSRIDYTGNAGASLQPYASIRFDYEHTPDSARTYIYGKMVRRSKCIRQISLCSGDSLMKRFNFSYSLTSHKKLLSQVTEYAANGDSLRPTTFQWHKVENLSLNLVRYNQTASVYKARLTVGDYNGDGKSDFVATPIDANAGWSGWKLFISTGDNFVQLSSGSISSGEVLEVVSGDFNGDGKDDIAVLRRNGSNYSISLLCSTGSGFQNDIPIYDNQNRYSIRTIEANADGIADLFLFFHNSTSCVTLSSSTALFVKPLFVTASDFSPLTWDEVELGDFNGDGLTDVYNTNGTSAYIMFSGGNGWFTNSQYVGFSKDYQKHFGDFNGDGKTDIIATSCEGQMWSYWWLYAANGIGVHSEHYLDNMEDVRDKQFFVTDVNGDGFDDCIGVDKTDPNGYNTIPTIWLNDGTGHHFTPYSNGDHVYPTDRWNFYQGDFNGDGKGDLLCTANWIGNTTWTGFQLFLTPGGNHLLLSKITDGLGNETDITYKYMSNDSVHTKGTTNDYPLSSFTATWPVVYQVKTPNGIGGQNTMTYKYENALIHRGGRGVLGFEKVIVKDETNNTTTTTEYGVEPHKYIAAPTRSQTKIGNRIVSEKETVYNTLYSNDTFYSYHPVSTTDRTYEYTSGDLLSETTTTYTYDSYGNVTQMVSTLGDITTTTVNSYTNDTNNWILGRLTSSTVTKTGTSGSETRQARFTYHPQTGLLMSETTEPNNQTLGFTKTYQRDVFGNITQSTTTPNSSYTGRTDYTYYDGKGRYIIGASNSLNHTTVNTIDENRGLLMASEDANHVTTTYSYDSFGRQTMAITPVSQTTSSMSWSTGDADAPAFALYYVLTQTTGSPYRKEFFDRLGRSIRIVTENAFGSKIYADVVYNGKGQVAKSSEPYFPGSTIQWNRNEYDAAGRIIRQVTPAGAQTTFSYNGYVTTSTDALGHQSIRESDQYGNLVQSTDHEGNTIDYEYDLNGHCTLLTGPRTTVRMEYDLMGNRTLLDDPDLGLVSSTYNAYGELVSQTDSKGTTTCYYDALGRLYREERPDVTVNSVYDTLYKGLLTSTSTSDGNSVSYQYDTYGRTIQQTDVIGNRTFTTQTTYNSQNKVDVITYPSGLTVRHQYATNGILTAVRNASTNALYWQLTQQDARGNVTQETFGNGLVTTNTYNAATGYLTGISTPGIQNWTYQYNLVGNLTQRKDNTRNLTETFEYDTLNRLVKVRKDGQLTQEMAYDAAGNILSKTGVGTNFTYQDGTNRLMSYDADGYEPAGWDSIHYTSFHKISYISQGNKTLALTYGPAKTRVKAVQTVGQATKEKYYVGQLYEVTYSNEGTRQICYIFAAGKAIAIHETLDNVASVRYLHHDHLGSIQAYSNEYGALAQELSYDAWGRRRNPTTWEYYEAISDANAWQERGFGGHEHLDLFEMVNMDGRMYDPVIGRFLSADPFVQAPDYTQGLNRYIYCLNNPLTLIDPSGYSWLGDNWKTLVSSVVAIAVSIVTYNAVSGIKALGSLAALVACTAGGAAGGAAGALTASLLNGSNIGQITRNTLCGAFWGGISGFLTYGAGEGSFLEVLFKHTFSQGWLEGIQGGNIVHGVMMGAVSGSGGSYIHNNLQALGKVGEISANAILSGTVSELGGGKFANGAITGAFHIMFNDMAHSIKFKHINWKKVVIELRKLYKKYNEDNNPDLYRMQGGEIYKKVYMECPDRTRNACALKLCIALEKAGFFFSKEIPNTFKAANGHYYFVSAKYFNNYLSEKLNNLGATRAKGYDNYYVGTGIVYQSGNTGSASGHIDAMYKGIVGGHIYTGQSTNFLYY